MKRLITPTGTRRIHQNVWGNWYGYFGARRVEDFGTDGMAAEHWLKTGKIEWTARKLVGNIQNLAD